MADKPQSAELHPGAGFRVQTSGPRPERALTDQLRAFDTPDISDLLNRMYAVDPGIKSLSGLHRICGPVCTVKVFPGDNLMVHKALDVARPGDIIVVDARGSLQNAVLGDIICTKAKHRKIAGFVVDGLIRDLPAILELDFPVFARGTSPIGPLHRGPGEINYPVCCGGMVVNPGDVVVGDAAGLVIVPQDILQELLLRLEARKANSASYLANVKQGVFSNKWVDLVLEQHQCQVLRASGEGAEGGGR
jgi:RraA family protein